MTLTSSPGGATASARAARIAAQNDAFRRAVCLGERRATGTAFPEGRLVATAGIHARGPGFLAACLAAIGRFDAFTPDNDPYGEHDFGEVTVLGLKVWFKFDLYDRDYEYGSDAPERTARVLTILFPEDW